MNCPRCIGGQLDVDDDGLYCLQCGWHLWLNPYEHLGVQRWPPIGRLVRRRREEEPV